MIIKVLIPADPLLFKQELLKRKLAKRTIIYKDGSVKEESWNANRLTPSSDLMGNINSQLWHRKDRTEIVKAIYEIMDYNNDDKLIGIDNVKPGELYIHYRQGWSSHEFIDEHMEQYIIEDDKITIYYNVWYAAGRIKKKTIAAHDMQQLISILNKAIKNGTLASSDSELRTVHGPVCTFNYRYRGKIGNNCGALINDNVLSGYYHDLIKKIIK